MLARPQRISSRRYFKFNLLNSTITCSIQPFNVNKFDIDVKNGGYVMKNSIKGDKIATSFEMKRADVLCGLIPALQQPYKTTLAGGNMKCEMARSFASGANNLSCDFNTDTAVETGLFYYFIYFY